MAIDFDILWDSQDPRSPAELLQQIDSALRSSSSIMRAGSSGYLLDGAKIEILQSEAPAVTTNPEPVQPVFPPRQSVLPPPVLQPLTASGFAPPNFQSEQYPPVELAPPPAVTPVVETVDALLGRVAVLSAQLDEMRIQQEKSDAANTDLTGRLSESEARVREKMKEADDIRAEVEKTKSELFYRNEQLEEAKRNLAQAKEMWMKESARATKLREQLDKSEADLADRNKEVTKLQSVMKKTDTENVNLKHLLNRSNGIVSTQVLVPETLDHSFPQSDSYFVRTGPLASRNLDSQKKLTPNHSNGVPTSHISNGVPSKYLQLCVTNDGVLFEDEIIQIGIKAKFSGLGEGVLGVYYGNKTSGILQNLQTKFSQQTDNSLHLTTSPLPNQLGPKSQICQRVSVQLSSAFLEAPKFTVSFLRPDNTPRTLAVRLPVTINKFMQGRDLSGTEFFGNWRQQLFLLNESSGVANVVMNLAQIARACTLGGALTLHHQIDETPDNLVLVGQFPSDSVDGIRCVTIPEALVLVRIEVGTGAQFAGKARIAVRSNDPLVAQAVRDSLSQQISI